MRQTAGTAERWPADSHGLPGEVRGAQYRDECERASAKGRSAVRPRGSPGDLERRRRMAVGMLQEDLPLREIARKVGCHASSVLRWRDAWRRGGDAALKAKPVPGRPPRLTPEQKRRLVAFLERRGAVCITRRQPWAARQVAAWIEQLFGVKYHPNHVAKLLHCLEWDRQKPGN